MLSALTEMQSGPVPGVLERIVEMHDSYYGARWGFGAAFTRKNMSELADFLGGFDAGCDGLWTAWVGGRIEGSVAVNGSCASIDGTAELRWLLVSDLLRGHGAGSRLLDAALGFCRDRGFKSVHLWTFAGLDQARKLYDSAGFLLVEQHPGRRWGYRGAGAEAGARPTSDPISERTARPAASRVAWVRSALPVRKHTR